MYLPMMRNNLFTLSCLVLGLLLHGAAHAESYHLGQGITKGEFTFSGYGNVELEAPNGGTTKLAVDDLSLFVSGRVNRWVNPFFEAELSSITLAQTGGNEPWSHGHFVPERFYNDMHLTDADTLRIGKILSPVGDWNLVHAAPLVPTVTRPLTTYRGFSEYANGLSWLHDTYRDGSPEWQLYWQPGKEWLRRPDNIAPRHYRDVVGAHVGWQLGLVDMVGLSYQSGTLTNTGEKYALVGVNGRRTFGPLMLESEAVTSHWSGSAARAHDTEWGLYALADYTVTPRWHGIVEWEHYQDHQVVQASQNTLFGVAYKPEPALVWKLEYVHQTGAATGIGTGWYGCFAVLF